MQNLRKSMILLLLILVALFGSGCLESSSLKNTPAATKAADQAVSTENLHSSSADKSLQSAAAPGSAKAPAAKKSSELKVHFLNVGQADAELLELPNGQTMLIDAGNNGDADFLIRYLKREQIKKIDWLVGTHPHEDHIGGMDSVIENFPVGEVVLPQKNASTKSFKDVLAAVKKKKIRRINALAGESLLNNQDLKITVLAPEAHGYKDLNNYSAVVEVIYGKRSFLFEGDAESLSEEEIMASGDLRPADVIKVGHHGSSSSSETAYLDRVSPRFAVISVGTGNDYGHPSQKTVNRLKKAGAQVLRTDRDGTLVFESNGRSLTYSRSSLGNPDN